MFDVHVVKNGTFITSSDTDSDHIRRPRDIGFMSHSEVSALESGFKSLRIRLSDSQDTCGGKVSPQIQKGKKRYPDTCVIYVNNVLA
mgnify:CR=1 FL=1